MGVAGPLLAIWLFLTVPKPVTFGEQVGYLFAVVFLFAAGAASLLLLAIGAGLHVLNRSQSPQGQSRVPWGWIMAGTLLLLAAWLAQGSENSVWEIVVSFAAWIFFLLMVPAWLLASVIRHRRRARAHRTGDAGLADVPSRSISADSRGGRNWDDSMTAKRRPVQQEPGRRKRCEVPRRGRKRNSSTP